MAPTISSPSRKEAQTTYEMLLNGVSYTPRGTPRLDRESRSVRLGKYDAREWYKYHGLQHPGEFLCFLRDESGDNLVEEDTVYVAAFYSELFNLIKEHFEKQLLQDDIREMSREAKALAEKLWLNHSE